PDRLITSLNDSAASLQQSLAELTAVREGLGDGEQFRFPALCGEWGQAYYQAELTMVRRLAKQLAAQQQPPQPAPEGPPGGPTPKHGPVPPAGGEGATTAARAPERSSGRGGMLPGRSLMGQTSGIFLPRSGNGTWLTP